MHIPLPDAAGRRQILGIHLRKARDAGLVSPAVDDAFLAEQTQGFSGADLAGLVRSATSFAIADWRGVGIGNSPDKEDSTVGWQKRDKEEDCKGKADKTERSSDTSPPFSSKFPPASTKAAIEFRFPVVNGDEGRETGDRKGRVRRKAKAGRREQRDIGGLTGRDKLRITVRNFEMALLEVRPSVRGSFMRRLRERIAKIVRGVDEKEM